MPEFLTVLPTVTSILAAFVAAFFAYRANQATIANQRILELEKRLATHRLEIYRPLIDAMAAMFTAGNRTPQETKRQQDTFMSAGLNFATWVTVFGSDRSVQVYHRMMQAAYASAPPEVMLRLYGEFLLAARRDMGDPATQVDLVDVLGIRLNDIYRTGLAKKLRMPDADYYHAMDWTPPWIGE
jgi:hypothetical protein